MRNIPINDEPELDVVLLPERQRLLNKLVDDIRRCTPPMVFGVHGDWGAGKTSFLQAAQYALTGNCARKSASEAEIQQQTIWRKAPLAVWFEAWRYQNEPAPVIALLHELRAQLEGWSKAGDVIKAFGGTVWRNALLALDSITAKIETEAGGLGNGIKGTFQFSPFQIGKAREERRKERLATPLPSNQLRDSLDEVFAQLLGRKKDREDPPKPHERIVIFIDDLDRCSPAAMFALLESIKIYMNLRHCVFVLGVNRHEVERGIISILPEPLASDEKHARANEYIEKLCGNMVRLPYPSESAQKKLVTKWLAGLDDHSREDLIDLLSRHRFLPQNPRRIKMWCNTVLQLHAHRQEELREAPPTEEIPSLALVACLHTFYPQLHQVLATTTGFLPVLQRWCHAEDQMSLEILGCVKRVFVMPALISRLEGDRKLYRSVQLPAPSYISETLDRAYLSSMTDSDETEKQPAPVTPQRIPLISDPSSLHFFHPQSLVDKETITEKLIVPYLHLN